MVHGNGARTVEAAAAAGVDSVEHGAYLDGDALCAMAENGTVCVEGSETTWMYGVLPAARPQGFGCEPKISDFAGKIFSKKER